MIAAWQIWIVGGAVLAPVSLWWARRGWLELQRLEGLGDLRASGGEVVFGYFAVTAMAFMMLGLSVPAFFFALRQWKVEPSIAFHRAALKD